MPIIDHATAPEVPWRPNYRNRDITQRGDGTTSSSMSRSVAGAGAGSPLHIHDTDELIVVLDGTLEVKIGDELQRVGPNHTIAVPPHTPHGITGVGPNDAHVLTFFPVQEPGRHTTYLEGGPPGTPNA